MDFKEKFNKWTIMVNEALEKYSQIHNTPEGNIYRAMQYSLTAGGKRLRPVLALAVCELLGGNEYDVLPYACAIEMIHTYSLIHDDLPAMDNDDYRRGIPTSHKVFGEAMAILAGDALLNHAFEVMLGHSMANQDKLPERIKAMEIIAVSAGIKGMIGGQVIDMESEGKKITAAALEYMHRCKTGALIKAPVLSAAVLCCAGEREYGSLEEYAGNIGFAFQIKDDMLDVEGSLENMGKRAGSDAANNKSTFVSLYGMDESGRLLSEAINCAVGSLGIFDAKADFLRELAVYIEKRNN